MSLDEIDSLIAERRFAEAAELADTIDWTRVRGVHVLCRISDLYKINKRYVDSRDLMALAYERNPSGRKIIYSLCELELKLNNYIHALQLYNAFINVAPRDSDRYLLQYKLYKKQDVNVYEQIAVLEEFLQHDFRERWAYELATLYLRAGEEQRCIRQCDEIVAYFGDGRFVIRALELKKSLTPLTPQQEERLEILKSGGTIAPPAPAPASEDSAPEDAGTEASDQTEKSASGADASGTEAFAEQTPGTVSEEASGLTEDGRGGQELPAEEKAAEADAAQSGATARMPELRKAPAKTPAASRTASDSGEKAPVKESRPVSDTIPVSPRKVMPDLPKPPQAGTKPAGAASGNAVEEEDETAEPVGTPEEYTDALLRDVNMQETIARGMREIEDYDNVLAQETSGQFAMVIEEEKQEEPQVEGQLNLEQIMSEWEKIRKDSEQQRLAEARRRVMERSEAAKRELYGAEQAPAGQEASGNTRSWKKEDVESGLK